MQIKLIIDMFCLIACDYNKYLGLCQFSCITSQSSKTTIKFITRLFFEVLVISIGHKNIGYPKSNTVLNRQVTSQIQMRNDVRMTCFLLKSLIKALPFCFVDFNKLLLLLTNCV